MSKEKDQSWGIDFFVEFFPYTVLWMFAFFAEKNCPP